MSQTRRAFRSAVVMLVLVIFGSAAFIEFIIASGQPEAVSTWLYFLCGFAMMAIVGGIRSAAQIHKGIPEPATEGLVLIAALFGGMGLHYVLSTVVVHLLL